MKRTLETFRGWVIFFRGREEVEIDPTETKFVADSRQQVVQSKWSVAIVRTNRVPRGILRLMKVVAAASRADEW
ncbi:hypothetical protein HBI56_131530 [Parastagonospora nodorum]|nr:hypothetical protein HBH54_165400 [Parastagonospora nodorum]KAH3940322.1 hypothetical protein HBH53_218340 [Parastagonospora nodorum]KAH3972113.1 hypothetical protein HBH51_107710 [Parastagonospora nodorum]KAH3996892.1 hypothetical protein HBI10_153450 [Parastagonospora nodorum]KAH4012581.1 hypothetical protein HBI13_188140 [Parastagonospora nodorum]